LKNLLHHTFLVKPILNIIIKFLLKHFYYTTESFEESTSSHLSCQANFEYYHQIFIKTFLL